MIFARIGDRQDRPDDLERLDHPRCRHYPELGSRSGGREDRGCLWEGKGKLSFVVRTVPELTLIRIVRMTVRRCDDENAKHHSIEGRRLNRRHLRACRLCARGLTGEAFTLTVPLQ